MEKEKVIATPDTADVKVSVDKKVSVSKSKISVDEMMSAGVHLGHRTSKLNPKMSDFVVGIRNTVHVIDLEKTAKMLETALAFISETIKSRGVVLLVCSKTPLQRLVKETAEEANIPYVAGRWLGGTFTNFDVINQRAKYFNTLTQEKAEGKLDKYTKKERIKIEKELQDLSGKFEGIKNLEKLPEVVFICDIVKDDLALKEAAEKGIKTVAIIDTNADISKVDYPIPANDDAISSVKYILDKLKDAIINNQ